MTAILPIPDKVRKKRRLLRICLVLAIELFLIGIVYPSVRRYLSARFFLAESGMDLPGSAKVIWEDYEFHFTDYSYAIKFRVSEEDMKLLLRRTPSWAGDGWQKKTEMPEFFHIDKKVIECHRPGDTYYKAYGRGETSRRMVIDVSRRIVYFENVSF